MRKSDRPAGIPRAIAPGRWSRLARQLTASSQSGRPPKASSPRLLSNGRVKAERRATENGDSALTWLAAKNLVDHQGGIPKILHHRHLWILGVTRKFGGREASSV